MAHRAESPVSPVIRRRLAIAVAVSFVATVAGMVMLWPSGEPPATSAELGLISELHDGRVVAVRLDAACPGTEPDQNITCPVADVTVLDGPDEGKKVTIQLATAFRDVKSGERVVLGVNPGAPPEQKYSMQDRDRQPVLLWLFVAFSVTVVILGGLRGGSAILGLVASLAVLIVFVLPAILDGESPVWVAVVGASAIAFLALFVAHGLTSMTAVALLGTLASLALTAALAALFVAFSKITGLASEEAALVNFGAAQIDLQGLILAGVVLGGLGAIDDMTVTQASAVWELRGASPAMSDKLLFRAGMRIGRDHVASTVNTLALAYAGASMPLLVLFVLSGQSLAGVANSEVVATEIVRTLVGSIGLVTAVPFTTWLAAKCVPRGTRPVSETDAAIAEVALEAASEAAEDSERDFWKGVDER